MTDNRFINRSELIGILVLAAFLVVILPLCLESSGSIWSRNTSPMPSWRSDW